MFLAGCQVRYPLPPLCFLTFPTFPVSAGLGDPRRSHSVFLFHQVPTFGVAFVLRVFARGPRPRHAPAGKIGGKSGENKDRMTREDRRLRLRGASEMARATREACRVRVRVGTLIRVSFYARFCVTRVPRGFKGNFVRVCIHA